MDKKLLLGKRIKELRKRKNISQEKLAEIVGVDPTTISNIENGKNYPSLINLENLIDALGCTFLDVFDFDHKNSSTDLRLLINEILDNNPQNLEIIYKLIVALVK